MNIQIIGTKKSNNTKKAIRFFKERNIKFHFMDLNERKIAEGGAFKYFESCEC